MRTTTPTEQSAETDPIEYLDPRLKQYYPDFETVRDDQSLIIRGTLGEIRVSRDRTEFFLGRKCTRTLKTHGPELYEEIESFLLAMREGERECTPLYTAACEKAEKPEKAVSWIGLVLMYWYAVQKDSMSPPLALAVLFVVIPTVVFLIRTIARALSLRRNWVCPSCGQRLSLERKGVQPQPRYVSSCPHCGAHLVDQKQVEQLQREIRKEEKSAPELSWALPKPGGKGQTIVSGILILLTVPLLILLTLVKAEDVPTAIVVLDAALVLWTAVCGILLLCCRSKPRICKAHIVVRERPIVGVLGVCIWVLGLMFNGLAVLPSKPGTADLVEAVLFAVLGCFFLGIGVWMVLARRNRSLFVTRSSLIYGDSFGKERAVDHDAIGEIRLSASGSIRFFDCQGKKLFAVESNMLGTGALLDWLEGQNYPVRISQQLKKRAAAEDTVTWRETDCTGFHRHLGAIRAGLVLVTLLLAAGNVLPLTLYLHDVLKAKQTILLLAASPLPILIYYLIFAPVLLVNDWPESATAEWQSMHIKFPVVAVMIMMLGLQMQVGYAWGKYILQVVDRGRFYVLVLVLAVVLIAAVCLRTPKRLRGVGLALMALSVSMMAYVMAYGGNLALCGAPRHYPAVVVERSEPEADEEDSSFVLTLRLDDGTEADVNVFENVYYAQRGGMDFVVCEKKSILGIRMVKLHLPK